VPAALDLAKRLLPQDAVNQFEADVAPYLDPLESISLSLSNDAASGRSRLVITVTTPQAQ
jgi:hypothetical protein